MWRARELGISWESLALSPPFLKSFGLGRATACRDWRTAAPERVAAARAALADVVAFDAAWVAGRALALEQAIDLAMKHPAAGVSLRAAGLTAGARRR